MTCLNKGGKAVKMLKTNYYESLLVTNFVQTCILIEIYNGMYTVCSYAIPQWTGQTGLTIICVLHIYR